MRAFLALPIPEPTLGALVGLQGDIPLGRPVPEDNLHLTLAFLGDVDRAPLEALDTQLRGQRLPSPEITFGGFGTFGEMSRGLVFVEVHLTEPLAALQSKIMQVARGAGIDLPRRRFRPHVTLHRSSRAPRGAERDRLARALGLAPPVPGFTAHRLCLYQSHLMASGARHDVLADYPLG